MFCLFSAFNVLKYAANIKTLRDITETSKFQVSSEIPGDLEFWKQLSLSSGFVLSGAYWIWVPMITCHFTHSWCWPVSCGASAFASVGLALNSFFFFFNLTLKPFFFLSLFFSSFLTSFLPPFLPAFLGDTF